MNMDQGEGGGRNLQLLEQGSLQHRTGLLDTKARVDMMVLSETVRGSVPDSPEERQVGECFCISGKEGMPRDHAARHVITGPSLPILHLTLLSHLTFPITQLSPLPCPTRLPLSTTVSKLTRRCVQGLYRYDLHNPRHVGISRFIRVYQCQHSCSKKHKPFYQERDFINTAFIVHGDPSEGRSINAVHAAAVVAAIVAVAMAAGAMAASAVVENVMARRQDLRDAH